MKKIDLHVHSNISDGSYTPVEIIRLAKEKGLAAVTLTDHDSIAGDGAAMAEARRMEIDFLPGMEMTTDYAERRLHIICLGFDPQHPAFRKLYKKIRSIKEAQIPELIAGVAARGLPITPELVRPYANGCMDRYAVMRYLVSLHLYDRAQPLWDLYLDPVVAELGLNYNVRAEEALPLVHEAGGITSLAHFHKKIGLRGLERSEQEKAIAQLHAMGLDGMERWYPSYTAEDAAFAAQMIERYELVETGGTDFHGTNRVGIELGTGWQNNLQIPYACYEKIAALTQG